MIRKTLLQRIAFLTVLVLLTTSCGATASESSDTTTTTQPAPSTTQATTTTTVAPTTTVALTTTTAPPVFENGVGKIGNLVYLEMDGLEYRADVYLPEGEGPWPVVVAFHGAFVKKGHETNTLVARGAARAGMVVFAPNWVDKWRQPLRIGPEEMALMDSAFRCSLAYAQQEAASYGGDPNRTVVYGNSAGAHPAAQLALNPADNLDPGCFSQTAPVAPIGVVVGEAGYFLHNSFFNDGFDTDPVAMQANGAGLIDPALWPTDLSAKFRLWAVESGTFPREVDDPWDEDGWLAQRDPDGSIRKDLDELGGLDDGDVDYVDAGLLLVTRLQRAGLNATFDTYPGEHTTVDKVPELVAYLLDVAEVP